MSNISFLEFQYKLSRNKLLRKPSRLFSSRDRQSSSTLPSFQVNLNEMRQVFNKFDSNKDGKISQQEYKATLRALRQDKMIAEVPKIFQVVDLDGDGYIDFREFIEAQKKGGGIKMVDIQSAFQAFDSNGDGKITAEEVMEVLRRLGERCTLEDCRRMVRAVDTDGDGMVNMDEFTTMMTQTLVSS
ncbi:calmodulin-like protein 30 [Jatropha curcas]|uniref:calmodulin-like protein 30 n=1 Tax=Jatropha curcas TaxID=180498 RepID=UPI0005FBAD3A|nr:calmodulin-like protein 30 [Jatropha curcas]